VCRLQTLAVLSSSRPFKTGQKLRKVSAKRGEGRAAATEQPGSRAPDPPWPAYSGGMARIILFIVAAAAILVLLWVLLGSLLHMLAIGFWIVLIVLIGSGLFRIGRRRRSRQ
jgi:Flp pilus assembly protein TadB